jgi:hypothetical protein
MGESLKTRQGFQAFQKSGLKDLLANPSILISLFRTLSTERKHTRLCGIVQA